MKDTKMVVVPLVHVQPGDEIHTFGPIGPGGDGKYHLANGKPFRAPSTSTSKSRVVTNVVMAAKTHTLVFDDWSKRFALGNGAGFVVARPMNDDEIAERAREERDHFVKTAVSAIDKARDTIEATVDQFVAELKKDPVRAASTIEWKASQVARTEGEQSCWLRVQHGVEVYADQDRVPAGDAHVVRAVVAVANEVRTELLRGTSSSRSTNAYANACDDDLRYGQATWLRESVVAWIVGHAAEWGVSEDER